MDVGECLLSASHTIDKTELIAFAKIWDPLPFHVNEEAGHKAFGGITAPGVYVLAVKQRLIHQLPPQAVIASMGYDEVRFHEPLRPGDTVILKQEWISKRASNSKPDRGIVQLRFTLLNQDDKAVMTHLDTILVRRLQPA